MSALTVCMYVCMYVCWHGYKFVQVFDAVADVNVTDFGGATPLM